MGGSRPDPGPESEPGGDSRRKVLLAVAAVVLVAAIAFGVVLLTGDDEAEGQTVRFQAPTEPGPDPFTKPADVAGGDRVRVGSGPYGGTGSDLVCDRELLIRSLRAQPDRLRAWAAVMGIEPTATAVARHIRRLRPVTLTTDTRITNHSFAGGQAVAFQSILQAGTAVLVDSSGRPVVRCRCGNPLAEPVFIAEATCLKCPANYTPPPPCDDYSKCWRRYPTPPPVRRFGPRPNTDDTFEEPPPPRQEQPAETPAAASFSPSAGGPTDTYVLSVTGFDPNIQLSVMLVRPDGQQESYSFTTGSDGSGSYTFPNAGPAIAGTYTAVVTGGGEQAQAATTVREEGGNPPGPEVGGGTDCNNPRSQDERDLCSGNVPDDIP